MNKFLKRFYWVFISLFIVLADQISKLIIVNKIEYKEEVTVIEDFFYLTYWKNTGIAFGFFRNQGSFSKIWIAALTAVLIVIAAVAIIKKVIVHPVGIIALSFIIGGGIGNLIDRIVLRYVVDFLGFIFGGWRFAVFNVADMFVTVGTCLFLVYFIFFDKEKQPAVVNSSDKEFSETNGN